MTIGERIRQRREELGISQTALADAVNSTKQNIYKYETGAITNIPSDKIEQIAAVLHVTPSYLMGWEESRTEINERIKQRRKELGLSAEQVADMIGVSPATVYRYESSDIKNMPAERLKPKGCQRKTFRLFQRGKRFQSDRRRGKTYCRFVRAKTAFLF